MSYHATLDKGGEIVIPADLLQELGFKAGDTLVLEREGDGLVIKTYTQVVREIQATFRHLATDRPSSMVDELLAERKIEAEREAR